jgi:lauroyl/myristoyl acyltransferase
VTLRDAVWSLARLLHAADFGAFLPLIARLPLAVGYRLSWLRGKVNGRFGRDWRSLALGWRHVYRQSAVGFRRLYPDLDDAALGGLVRKRFETESREEFEGQLIAAGRVAELHCDSAPEEFLNACRRRERGLVLLTPHFDSFTLGIVFLGQMGIKVNAISSEVTADPRVAAAVRKHFHDKYRGMERWMNGGRILDQEAGLRPFYQMLKHRECLVVLADTPATEGAARIQPTFMGRPRALAGGALRMATHTGSDLGAFTCRYLGPAHYRLEGGPIGLAAEHASAESAYGFLSTAIDADPGRWWAADLLPAMALVDTEMQDV